jgi:hypothetical protein
MKNDLYLGGSRMSDKPFLKLTNEDLDEELSYVINTWRRTGNEKIKVLAQDLLKAWLDRFYDDYLSGMSTVEKSAWRENAMQKQTIKDLRRALV